MKNTHRDMLDYGKITANKLQEYLESHLPAQNIKVNKYDVTIISFLAKALRSFRSILCLAEEGEVENAMILLRSEFENVLLTYWLFFKSSKRLKRFKLYSEKEVIETFSMMSHQHTNSLEMQKLVARHAKLLIKYNARNNSQLKRKHRQVFPTINKLSQERYRFAGKEQSFFEYCSGGVFYEFLCSYTHIGPFTRNTVFKFDDGAIRVIFSPNYEQVPLVLHQAIHFLLLLFYVFDSFYKLKAGSHDQMKKKWDDLYEKTVNQS